MFLSIIWNLELNLYIHFEKIGNRSIKLFDKVKRQHLVLRKSIGKGNMVSEWRSFEVFSITTRPV